MDLGLSGKVALVTGAGRGVGREIALTLAREGARVAINYRSSAKDADALAVEIAAAGGKAKTYKADVGDFAAVTAMVGDVVTDFGALNILINNAGLARRDAVIGEMRRQPSGALVELGVGHRRLRVAVRDLGAALVCVALEQLRDRRNQICMQHCYTML